MQFTDGYTKWEFQPGIEGMDPVEQALRVLEADLAVAGWDQPAQFFVILQSDLGLGFRSIALPEHCGTDPSGGLPFFLDWLTGDEDMPAHIKERAFRVSQIPRGPIFKGLVMISEGWTLDPDQVPREEFNAAFAEHRVSEHSQRIDARDSTAYLTDGTWASIHRIRGKIPQFVSSTDLGLHLSGHMPSNMVRFVEICQRLVNEYK